MSCHLFSCVTILLALNLVGCKTNVEKDKAMLSAGLTNQAFSPETIDPSFNHAQQLCSGDWRRRYNAMDIVPYHLECIVEEGRASREVLLQMLTVTTETPFRIENGSLTMTRGLRSVSPETDRQVRISDLAEYALQRIYQEEQVHAKYEPVTEERIQFWYDITRTKFEQIKSRERGRG